MIRLLRHLTIIAIDEFEDLFRRRRAILALALYAVNIGLVIVSLYYATHSLGSGMQALRPGTPQYAFLLEKLRDQGHGTLFAALSRFNDLPAELIVTQASVALFLPTLIALISCDVVAADISRKSIRFLLTKTSRGAIYLGKLLAHFALYCLLQLLSLGLVLVLFRDSNPNISTVDFSLIGLRYLAVSAIFSFFCLALTQFVSGWSGKPIGAVIKINLLWLLFGLIAIFHPELTPVNSGNFYGLIYPFAQALHRALLGWSCWSVGVLALGYLIFIRKEV